MFINLRRPMLTSIDMLSSAEWLQQADKKMRPEKKTTPQIFEDENMQNLCKRTGFFHFDNKSAI